MKKFMVEVTDDNYQVEVQNSALPVVIDFWAPWCNPCLALLPTVEAVAEIYEGRVKVVKVNADENKVTAEKFGVRGLPHLVVFDNGEIKGVLKQRTRTRLAMEFEEILKNKVD